MKGLKVFTYMIAALGLMTVAALADQAKSYRVVLPDAKIGSTALPGGEYSVLIDGSAVKLKEMKTGKVLEVPAKVGNLDKKASSTEVHSQRIDGAARINEIRLGGTTISIDFREQANP